MQQRLQRHLLAQLVTLGDHNITGLLCTCGRQSLDWSSDYRMYSRQRVEPEQLFQQVRTSLLEQLPSGEPVVVAVDDTRIRKSGKRWPEQSTRDPLGPPFHTNFIWAQRFLQLSMASGSPECARMIPVGWQHAPVAEETLRQGLRRRTQSLPASLPRPVRGQGGYGATAADARVAQQPEAAAAQALVCRGRRLHQRHGSQESAGEHDLPRPHSLRRQAPLPTPAATRGSHRPQARLRRGGAHTGTATPGRVHSMAEDLPSGSAVASTISG